GRASGPPSRGGAVHGHRPEPSGRPGRPPAPEAIRTPASDRPRHAARAYGRGRGGLGPAARPPGHHGPASAAASPGSDLDRRRPRPPAPRGRGIAPVRSPVTPAAGGRGARDRAG